MGNISPAPSRGNNVVANTARNSFERSTLSPVQRKPRILCLDGGGMRGIIEAEFLLEIERRSGKKVMLILLFEL
jgi:hypothetical protein